MLVSGRVFLGRLKLQNISDTVDGRNPAPPEMYGINYLSNGAGFQPSTVFLGKGCVFFVVCVLCVAFFC